MENTFKTIQIQIKLTIKIYLLVKNKVKSISMFKELEYIVL